jgi:bifunctional non-homologous end joining protein LigD
MGNLKEYNKKRDFKKTREPGGIKKKSTNRKLIFVVQEHHARRLHYDFRLELDGVLKSWAVPKGPSQDPADKRLAVQTEDHPLEYAKFHGTIPQGEYGGGEVFIWDKGSWETTESDPAAALEQGKLEFTLKGGKLKGKWLLVRTSYKGPKDKKNWLLMKRPQQSDSRGADAWPGFVPPLLPRLVSHPPAEGEWWHELKYDGYRIQTHLKNQLATFYTRNGLDWSNSFPHLLEAMGKLPVQDAILDGEIVALDAEGKSNFQRLQNSLKSKKDQGLRYYIFDILYLNGRDLRQLPLRERKKLLKQLLEAAPKNISYSEHFDRPGKDVFETACQHQLEGMISKLADSPYRSGRNELWLKSKCTARQEFVIGGFTEPQGGRRGLGALLLGVYEDGQLRYAGRVGTGFDQKALQELRKILTPLERKTSPFAINSPAAKALHWVRPVKLCEVAFANWTDEGILRAPVFLGLREDKAANEVSLERARAAPEKSNAKLKEISSPEKILFKQEKITKQQVADYYQTIGKAMLPYLAGRPLSVVRCPNGSQGSCFFQKHFSGKIPDAFHPFEVKEEKGQGIYIAIDSVAGLLELVQLNAFELHAWNCQQDDYLRPDQIVMDLDPGPGVAWKQTVEAAFELKGILDDLELKSFVKLTGGKGLHVHIPIAPLYDWDQVKTFAHSLALELVERRPKFYTTNMSKQLRKNKLFVDYLRNGYGATAVVPYSLRARASSAVALPVEWRELRRIKGPEQFTMFKALRKIKSRQQDPWQGMRKLQQKIDILQPLGQVA